MITALRVFAILVILALVAVAAVPLLVLVDLVGGGDGWGLCPNGLTACDTSYFDGLELTAALSVILFALLALLRLSFLARRALERRRATKVPRFDVPGSPPVEPTRRWLPLRR